MTVPGHPERPERLEAARLGAEDAGAVPVASPIDEPQALEGARVVHAAGLVERLRAASQQGHGFVDTPDNPVSAGTFRAAWRAVAASLHAAAVTARGEADLAWVGVRPPGHHARRDRAMGFCFFNNAAVAAEALLARGVGPLALVDFDVHHGNGTQEHFYRRDDVFFLSVHQYPFFPGTGSADETGAGPGLGFTRNFPLAAGAGDETYAEALAVGLEEVHRTLRPSAWVISAGFDAHVDDPVGEMRVSAPGFGRIGRLIVEAAAGTPVVAVMEGGYERKALRESVRSFLEGLAGNVAP